MLISEKGGVVLCCVVLCCVVLAVCGLIPSRTRSVFLRHIIIR